ncbi:MAG: hypothetical protein AAGM22_02530 [Acidobacteriota bacterium]
MPVIPRRRGARRARVLAPTLGLLLAGLAAAAPSFSQDVLFSPDITITANQGTLVNDQDVARDAGGVTIQELTGLPASVDVIAFDSVDGLAFFSVDTAVEVGGIIVRPADVATFDGGNYELFFKGRDSGIPRGVRLDAITVDGGGTLFFSIDVDAEIGGEVYRDDDVIVFDGGFEIFFKGQSSGVPPALDIDALAIIDGGDLVMSFDVGGTVDGIDIGDEDLLIYDGNWGLFDEGENLAASFAPADLDALALVDPINTGLIFADGFESSDTSAWDGLIQQ